MFTTKFWKDLAERSISTFAQAAGGYVVALGLDVVQADLKGVAVAAAAAGGFAVLKALVAVFRNPEQQSASLLDQPVATAPPGRHDGSQAPYGEPTLQPEQVFGEAPPNHQWMTVGVAVPDTVGEEPGDVEHYSEMAKLGAAEAIESRQRDPKTGRFLPRNEV